MSTKEALVDALVDMKIAYDKAHKGEEVDRDLTIKYIKEHPRTFLAHLEMIHRALKNKVDRIERLECQNRDLERFHKAIHTAERNGDIKDWRLYLNKIRREEEEGP